MSASGTRILFPLFALAFGSVLAFAALEAVLRLVDWPVPGLYRDGVGPLPLSMPNEDGSSWRAYPGPVQLRHWDYEVDLDLNRHGFVEREVASKRPGTWRIGVFGDSFVAGMGVAPESRFTNIWIETLRERFGADSVEVFNFGSVWCGSAQNARFLASHAIEYDLDEIVLAIFGGNELEDNDRWRQYAALTPTARAEADAAASSGETFRDWIRNHSRAAGFVYVTVAARLAAKTSQVTGPESLTALWAATEHALSSFATAADGRAVTIWYLPDTHEWDDEAWTQVQRSFGPDEGDRHLLRDSIERWTSEHRIPFIDVTPFLAGRSARDIRFRRDGHWNQRGHRIVGEALADAPDASWFQRTAGDPVSSLDRNLEPNR